MHCRVISCNNFPRPLQPLPTTLSYVTGVMLRALLSWLESRACFQACISHLAAHAAAGGQSAVSLFCQTSELVSDTESGKKNGEEWNVQWNWRGLLGVSVHFSVVIACDWFPVLVVIEWEGFCSFLLYFKWFAWPGKRQIFSYFVLIRCLSAYRWKTQFQENPLKFYRDKTVLSRCVYLCVCLCKHTTSHKHNLLPGSAPTMQTTNLKGL